MKKLNRVLVLLMIIALTSAFNSDDRLVFYCGERKIDYQYGISLTEINQLNNANKLHYVIREDLIEKVEYRNAKIEINLVRSGASIYTYRFDDVLSKKTLKIQRIYSSLRVGDTILMQFKGVEGILPQIIGIKIKA